MGVDFLNQLFYKILKRSSLVSQGIAAFWKGSVPTAGGMALENAMAFGYDCSDLTQVLQKATVPFPFLGTCTHFLYYLLYFIYFHPIIINNNSVNEALKRAFPDDPDQVADPNVPPDLKKPFVMGALTGCCSALVLLPSEVIKAKTQVVVGEDISSQEILKRMIRQSGYKVSFMLVSLLLLFVCLFSYYD